MIDALKRCSSGTFRLPAMILGFSLMGLAGVQPNGGWCSSDEEIETNSRNNYTTSTSSVSSFSQQEFEEKKLHLVLIAEQHDQPEGMHFVYEFLQKEKNSHFFIERDEKRLGWAKDELGILKNKTPDFLNSPDEFDKNHPTHRENLRKVKYLSPGLDANIYGSWDPDTDSDQEDFTLNTDNSNVNREGRLKNRFWLLKILNEFENQLRPIDASVEYVREQLRKQILSSVSEEESETQEIIPQGEAPKDLPPPSKDESEEESEEDGAWGKMAEERYCHSGTSQGSTPEQPVHTVLRELINTSNTKNDAKLMARDEAIPIRDEFMISELQKNIKPNAIHLFLVGAEHLPGLECRIGKITGSFFDIRLIKLRAPLPRDRNETTLALPELTEDNLQYWLGLVRGKLTG